MKRRILIWLLRKYFGMLCDNPPGRLERVIVRKFNDTWFFTDSFVWPRGRLIDITDAGCGHQWECANEDGSFPRPSAYSKEWKSLK